MSDVPDEIMDTLQDVCAGIAVLLFLMGLELWLMGVFG